MCTIVITVFSIFYSSKLFLRKASGKNKHGDIALIVSCISYRTIGGDLRIPTDRLEDPHIKIRKSRSQPLDEQKIMRLEKHLSRV